MNNLKNSIHFFWEGINEQGEQVHGEIFSESPQQLKQILQLKNIYPTKIRRSLLFFNFKFSSKVKHKHIVDFTHQLALSLQAGIELNQALTIITSESQQIKFKQLILFIKEKIEQGESLSQALATQNKYFDAIYISLITAGETSGTLSMMLDKLNQYQQQMLRIRQKISHALFYPVSVAMIAIIITSCLLLFVVPQFQNVFSSMGATLPKITTLVISLSINLHHYGIPLTLFLFSLFIFLNTVYKKIQYFKTMVEAFLFRFPIIKQLIHLANLMRVLQILHTLLQSGLPLVNALRLCESTLSLHRYREHMKRMIDAIENGQAFQLALKQNSLFDSRCNHMLTIAENIGNLIPTLKILAEQTEHQFNQLLDKMSKLLEPLLMIVLAIFIGTLIIAMYLPIFKLGSVV